MDDKKFIENIHGFLNYLIKVKQFKPVSIIRAVGHKAKHSIYDNRTTVETGIKIASTYINNYKEWKKLNNEDLEPIIKEKIKSMYGG